MTTGVTEASPDCLISVNPWPPRGVRCYTEAMKTTQAACDLTAKKCLPCEGGVAKYSPAEAEAQLAAVPGWQLTHDATRMRRDWKLKNFREGIKLLNNVGALAEREQHHPDLHLESYRHVWIEIFTHAIGGLSENDFILAAKIDQLAPPSS
jgi:4a-hydroxytetrahydrobiopterin dehydratase